MELKINIEPSLVPVVVNVVTFIILQPQIFGLVTLSGAFLI